MEEYAVLVDFDGTIHNVIKAVSPEEAAEQAVYDAKGELADFYPEHDISPVRVVVHDSSGAELIFRGL